LSSQFSPRIEQVRFRVGSAEWVIAKYCLDNGITRITAKEIRAILGSPKNFLTLYNVIWQARRDGLLKPVKLYSGVYNVDLNVAMALTQLVPYDVKNIYTSDVPQWKQAMDYAKSWQALVEWASKSLASDRTSPPSPQGQTSGREGEREGQNQPEIDPCKVPLPAVKYHIPVECVPTPSGRRALVAVFGNLYVILEEARGTHYLQCVPFDSYVPGARLCASKVDVLAKYLHRPAPERLRELQEEGERAKARALRELEAIQALSELRPGTYNLTVHVNPDGSVSIEVEVPEEDGQVAGVTPGGRGQTAGAMGTVPQASGGGLVLYDPLAPPQLPRIRRTDPIKAPSTKDITMVFDNVRYTANGQVQQMHGLQPMSTVLALADRLVYTEPGFQVYDPVLYELSKVMDIHIYHSKGKDPKGVIRIEARPRAKALRKLGLAGVVHAFVTALHRLGGVFQAIAQAVWSRWTRLK